MKVEVLLNSGEGGVAQVVSSDNVIEAIQKVARQQRLESILITSVQAKAVEV